MSNIFERRRCILRVIFRVYDKEFMKITKTFFNGGADINGQSLITAISQKALEGKPYLVSSIGYNICVFDKELCADYSYDTKIDLNQVDVTSYLSDGKTGQGYRAILRMLHDHIICHFVYNLNKSMYTDRYFKIEVVLYSDSEEYHLACIDMFDFEEFLQFLTNLVIMSMADKEETKVLHLYRTLVLEEDEDSDNSNKCQCDDTCVDRCKCECDCNYNEDTVKAESNEDIERLLEIIFGGQE